MAGSDKGFFLKWEEQSLFQQGVVQTCPISYPEGVLGSAEVLSLDTQPWAGFSCWYLLVMQWELHSSWSLEWAKEQSLVSSSYSRTLT